MTSVSDAYSSYLLMLLLNTMNKKQCVLILKRNLVKSRASQLKLSVILQEESHTIGLLSIQIDKYETRRTLNLKSWETPEYTDTPEMFLNSLTSKYYEIK